jgi:hypothetical protein
MIKSSVIDKNLNVIFIFEFINFKLITLKYWESFKKIFFFIDQKNTLNEKLFMFVRFLIISNFKYKFEKTKIKKNDDFCQIYIFSLLKYFEVLKLFLYVLIQLKWTLVLVFLKSKVLYDQYCKYFLKLKTVKNHDCPIILKNILNKRFLKKSLTKKLYFYYHRYSFSFSKLKGFPFKFYCIKSGPKNVNLNVYLNTRFTFIKNIQILGPVRSIKFIHKFRILQNTPEQRGKKNYWFLKKSRCFQESFKLNKNYFLSNKCFNFLKLRKSIERIIKIFINSFFKSNFENFSIWYNFCLQIKFDILFYSFSKFYLKNWKQIINKPIFFMNFLNFTCFKKTSISKKNLYTLLDNNRFFFWILKQSSYNYKLVFLLFKIENTIFNYGKLTLSNNIRKLFFEVGAQDSFLNRYMILSLSKYYKISFNNTTKKNFRGLSFFSVFPKERCFFINFFICEGSKKFFKFFIGTVLDTQFKKQLRYIGIILKLFKINGAIGKILIELLYSALFLPSWNLIDKKIFWKYWVFVENFKSNKISGQILFNLRLSFFFVNQYKLFNENFF